MGLLTPMQFYVTPQPRDCLITKCIHKVFIIIIIIKSRWRRGFPRLSLFIYPYHSSLPSSLSNYILCHRRTVIYKFLLVRPCEGIHWWTSLMNSSLLLKQCPTCLVRLTWMVFEMGRMWPYSSFLGCCFQEWVWVLSDWSSSMTYCFHVRRHFALLLCCYQLLFITKSW